MTPRVILLEDDELIRTSLTRFLSHKGYEVLSAPDPAICPVLQRLASAEFHEGLFGDFLLTDNNMPVLCGLQLIELQKKKGCPGGIPNKAVMSASWTEEDLAKAEELGCTVFHKPLDLNAVLAWLEKGKKSLREDRKLVTF